MLPSGVSNEEPHYSTAPKSTSSWESGTPGPSPRTTGPARTPTGDRARATAAPGALPAAPGAAATSGASPRPTTPRRGGRRPPGEMRGRTPGREVSRTTSGSSSRTSAPGAQDFWVQNLGLVDSEIKTWQDLARNKLLWHRVSDFLTCTEQA